MSTSVTGDTPERPGGLVQPSTSNMSRRTITTAILLVLALGIGVWAQRYLTDISVPFDGKIGYLIAAALFIVAVARQPAHVLLDTPRAAIVPRITSIVAPRWRRWLFLVAGGAFLVALALFGRYDWCYDPEIERVWPGTGYCFTPINTALWWLALSAFVVAAWDWRATDVREALGRLRTPRLTVSWTGLALLGVMLVGAWFLFYRLASVPAEPTSDHAEKLYDVIDILNGRTSVFLARNTGREPLYFYWVAWLVKTFNLTTDHLALKLAASLLSLITIPLVFLLGREVGGTGVGLLAAYFTAISKWFVAITRVGLRVPSAPLLATPALFFTLRGLRLNRRNDWVLAGLCIGLGVMTYTPSRMIPVLVALLIGLRLVWDVVTMPGGARAAWAHVRRGLGGLGRLPQLGGSPTAGIVAGVPAPDAPVFPTVTVDASEDVPPTLTRAFWTNVLVMAGAAAVAFTPLWRFGLERPDLFWFRSLTRASSLETGQTFNPLSRFLVNVWNAALQFNYRGDVVWVNTVSWEPQLDVVSGALFVFGFLYVLLAIVGVFYLGRRRIGVFAERRFTAGALLVSLVMLLMPSMLALAFPIENPSVFRACNAPPVVMIFVALPLVLVARQVQEALGRWGTVAAAILIGVVLLAATVQNYRSYFEVYDAQFRRTAGNTSEMAAVLKGFTESAGDIDHAWIVAYPDWVDTRNVFLTMGLGQRNNYIPSAQLAALVEPMVNDPAAKIFLLSPQDQSGLRALQSAFPNVEAMTYQSRSVGKDFIVFLVPAQPARK